MIWTKYCGTAAKAGGKRTNTNLVLKSLEFPAYSKAKDEYIRRLSKYVKTTNKNLFLFDSEGVPYGHGGGLEAGFDVCCSEHVWNICNNMYSVRGATKAYERPVWAAFMNVECYGGSGGWGSPKDDSFTPAHQRRMIVDYELSYICGADVIILQDCVMAIGIARFSDKDLNGKELYGGGKIDPSGTYHPVYDIDSSECRGFREKAKQFYGYAKSHPRSDQKPSVEIGLVYGNLEGTTMTSADNVVDGYTRRIWQQDGEAWKPTIENGWNNLSEMITTPGHPHRGKLCRYSGTPYGQMDIVPIRAPIDVLQKYKTLMFLGWNTMTSEIYGKLKEYVKNGGTLFMSLPQLSQQIERKPELELINNGDFRDLFGISIKGKLDGKAPNTIKFDSESSLAQCKLPVGSTLTYTNDYPQLAWADVKVDKAKVIASADEGKIPVLVENKFGKGTAYLMTSYSFSPAPKEFIKPLVEATVKSGDIELLGEMPEKKDINYAVYRGKDENEETKILLVNIDWTEADNVKNIKMRIKDMVMPLAVKEGAIKTVNVLGDLALTVSDDMAHCLSLEKRDGNKYTGKLSGQGVCVLKGQIRGGKAPSKVTLDGKDILFRYNDETKMFTAESNLWGEHVLEIQN